MYNKYSPDIVSSSPGHRECLLQYGGEIYITLEYPIVLSRPSQVKEDLQLSALHMKDSGVDGKR